MALRLRTTRSGRRRLLTIGHSYVIGANRRLAHELARLPYWDVTAVAPAKFRGDFGWHALQSEPFEACSVEPVGARFTRPVHLMLYGRRLRELLKQRWDLVHCWEEPYVTAAAQVAAATPCQVPLVFSTFQNIAKRYPPPFNWIERHVLNRADGVVAFGQTALQVLAARGFSSARSCVIPAGVDTIRFAPDSSARDKVRAMLGWADDDLVIGFLGRFVPEKGLDVLTGTLDRLSLPWRALFVGGGPLERQLRAWGQRYGDRVAVTTTVGHDDVQGWLNAMDVLCAPSQTTGRWREQFGRMLIEAFACGIPVVASRSGEIPFVVGDAGVLVDEADERGWKDAIERVLTVPPLRTLLATRGRERAVSLHDWSVIARQHASFFEQIIEGASAPERVA